MMHSLNRRTFLRSAGAATLALPWLESLAAEPARKPARRMAFYYVPIGVVRRDFFPGEQDLKPISFKGGDRTEYEKPSSTSAGVHPLRMTPTLSPLEKLQHKVTLVTGLDRVFQNGTDVHAQCGSCFLTSVSAYEVKESAYPQARTLDHIVADEVGTKTAFPTLEFSCNSHRNNKESIHFDNISWYGTDYVAPSMRDPATAYRRLFNTDDRERARHVTDLVLEDAKSLERDLGTADRRKLAEYFESIRAIEEQMDRLSSLKSELVRARPSAPPVVDPLPRGEYIRYMGDLLVVALQTGLTNVASLMVGPERWDTPMMFEGLFDKPVSHHQMSHDQEVYANDLARMDRFYMEQFAYLLGRMEGIQEADGTTLLDNTIFTYGSGLGDGATHQYERLPIVVAGSGGGKLRTGMQVQCAPGTPLANLWLTQARAMGLERERYADSTGELGDLLA